MKFFVLVFMFCLTRYVFAIPEARFKEDYDKKVVPFYQKSPSQFWTNSQGMKLHYKKFLRGGDKVIVMLPGRTDAVVRNMENIYDLYQRGYSIYMLDVQGQGESDRLLDDPSKGHVERFDDYINDFHGWMNDVVLKEVQNRELFLMGHSMGAAIGTLYVHAHPSVFKKHVALAPMYEILTGSNMRYRLAFSAVQRAVNNGLGLNYIPGAGPFDLEAYQYEGNVYTNSLVRFNKAKEIFVSTPKIALGGPTYNWAYQSMMAGWKFYNIGPEMRVPELLIQARYDYVVYNGIQNQFCAAQPDCRLFVAEAKHDILSERDATRDVVLKQITNFFK